MKKPPLFLFLSLLSASLLSALQAQEPALTPESTLESTSDTKPAAVAEPPSPPQAQAYITVRPGVQVVEGHTMVPVSFLQNDLGAALHTLQANKQWRLAFFGHTVEFYNNQLGIVVNGKQTQFPIQPRIINSNLYVPWTPIASLLGFKWSIPPDRAPAADGSSVMLVQYPGTYIEAVRHSVSNDKVRVVLDLSHATRVTARLTSDGAVLDLAAARRDGVPTVTSIGDVTVPNATVTSGNWEARVQVKLNYEAPVTWHTLNHPPRIVIDIEKIFEQSSSETIEGGISLTRIVRGTARGPVRIFAATIDPRQGWKMEVAPAGYSVLQRNRTSVIASRNNALLALNGGFFAFDGAAVGAVKVDDEWIRFPWKGRTALGLRSDGKAKIGNLQLQAAAHFSSGLKLPVRDLNGWPASNLITVITRRFREFYELRSGEMAAVVDANGVIISTPGSGGVNVPSGGFILVANGKARPELEKARKGLKVSLSYSSPGWEGYSSALGGGPRLLVNGKVDVKEEGFRSDVTRGTGPRTALGLDRAGRYILVAVDGRQKNYSTGLTLHELAYTMQKLGAIDALNLDGGGSTALTVRGKLVNRPSDKYERNVANALVIKK